MTLVRQSADTEIEELVGGFCEQLVVVTSGDEIVVFYMRVDDTWHRFFVDGGVLFWREAGRPDSEDDRDGEESYRDLGAELNMIGARIAAIGFHDGLLELSFANGAALVCGEGVRGARIVEKTRGRMG